MDDKLTPMSGAGPAESGPQGKPQEFQPGAEVPTPEAAPQPGSSPGDPGAVAASPPPPKLTTDQVAAAIASQPSSGAPGGAAVTPSTASDVDVIEPEWVDKAEHEIATHQGDPYGEEEAIEDLQQDYLDKRYGYKVSNPNTDSSKPEGT
jgi:hypothetical protein